MEYSEKQEHILRFIKTGLDLYSSCILAECTEEEIEDIETDQEFLKKVEVCNVIAERDLLKKMEIATDIAMSKGNAAPIQWMLEKLNPERWGKQTIDIEENAQGIPAKIVLRGGNASSDHKSSE